MAKTCEIGDEIIKAFNSWKVGKAKECSAIVLKINVNALKVEIEKTITDNASLAEIAETLPESVPRYIIYSYKWNRPDGRLQYPIVFIYYIPKEIKPALAMMYSSTKHELGVKMNVNKTLEIQVAEELNDQWLLERL